MNKRKIISFILLFSSLAVLFLYNNQAQAKIFGNGSDIIQSGKNIYYLSNYCDARNHSYELCSISNNNKNKKVLDAWKPNQITKKLFINGNKLYYQRDNDIYVCDSKEKSAKKIVSGVLLAEYDNKIYYMNSDENTIYVTKINKNYNKKIYSGSGKYSISYAGMGGKYLIINDKKSDTQNDILCIDMKTSKYKLLTTEGKVEDYQQGPSQAVDVYLDNKTLYYACGTFDGSMREFSGKLTKININGKGKKVIDNGLLSGRIIRGDNYVYYNSDKGGNFLHRINLKNGKVERISNENIYDIAGNYAYYSKTNNNMIEIYRYKVTENKSKAVKWVSIKKSTDYDYSISEILKVGNHIYVDLDVRRFDSDTGWSGEYKGIETYKIDINGKNIMRLNN